MKLCTYKIEIRLIAQGEDSDGCVDEMTKQQFGIFTAELVDAKEIFASLHSALAKYEH